MILILIQEETRIFFFKSLTFSKSQDELWETTVLSSGTNRVDQSLREINSLLLFKQTIKNFNHS